MSGRVARWEQGSDFDLRLDVAVAVAQDAVALPWHHPRCEGQIHGTGRSALVALITHGVTANGWRRLLVPDYFCQTVVTALAQHIAIRNLACDPERLLCHLPPEGAGANDAILLPNYFGRGMARLEGIPGAADVIEDHTHDPVSEQAIGSSAAYCVASLRKTLPIPDGAALWSPTGRDLPPLPTPSERHETAVMAKLAAMSIKALYLRGAAIDKQVFRDVFEATESYFDADTGPRAVSRASAALLGALPVHLLRSARRQNFNALADALGGVSGQLRIASVDAGGAPFSAVLIFDSTTLRNSVRAELIRQRIYPAILWSLDRPVQPVGEAASDFASRMLSLHVDARYSPDDLRRVAAYVRAAVDRAGTC